MWLTSQGTFEVVAGLRRMLVAGRMWACAQITCGCHALQALSQRDIPALQQKVADQEAAVAAAAERQEVAHTEAAEAQHALQVQLVLLCVCVESALHVNVTKAWCFVAVDNRMRSLASTS